MEYVATDTRCQEREMSTPSDEVFVDGELVEPQADDPDYPGPNPEFTTSKSLKEDVEEGEKKQVGKEGKKKGAENLKSSLIISAVAVAVIGAIFAVAKKMKEA